MENDSLNDWLDSLWTEFTATRFSEYGLILILDGENYRGFQRKVRDNSLGRTGLTHERGYGCSLGILGKEIVELFLSLMLILFQ